VQRRPSPARWVGVAASVDLRKAGRAAIVPAAVLAFFTEVAHNEEAALFGVLGSFVLLLLTDYSGPRRVRLQSYLGLSVASSALVVIGTACSEHLWVSVAAATAIPFLVLLGGVVSSIMASSATPLVSATVLPILISGPPGAIGDRLLGWAGIGRVHRRGNGSGGGA
jgi:hypothetical protein